ncbi:hypothetical protein [Streptomyces sp. NBC_00932]|uniref:hypothetical protein n=1 Tax=Streptomyces sp. NBC_00932 TaxID=2903690 RepID=UPI00386DEDF4|nr:hypothetical protein OG221_27650 [Streptomyces sp. NBC_00932]
MITALYAASPLLLAALGGLRFLAATYTFIVLIIVTRKGLSAAKQEDVPAVIASICKTISAPSGRRR